MDISYSYIYSLNDPDTDEIRYIGQTSDLDIRLNAHKSTAALNKKSEWIKELADKGQLPIMKIIEKVPASFADAKEAFHIVDQLSKNAKLFNTNYTHYLQTVQTALEIRLDLRCLLRTDAKNSGVQVETILNKALEFYYQNKIKYTDCTDISKFIDVKTFNK